MIIYEVKLTVHQEVEQEWIQWMKSQHVADLVATGLLKSYQILKPSQVDQVYLFHYYFENEADFKAYEQLHADRLREGVKQRYDGKFTGERTIYDII